MSFRFVPFGRECPYEDAFGINERKVRTVVALMAAEACGFPGATSTAVGEVVGGGAHSYLAELERKGWVELVGKVERSREKVWRATRRAWKNLGLVGWKTEVAA